MDVDAHKNGGGGSPTGVRAPRPHADANARLVAGLAAGSTAKCTGDDVNTRTCRFQNLCWQPRTREYVFLHGPQSSLSGVPANRFDPAVATLGGLQDHNLLHFSFIDAPAAVVAEVLLQRGGGGEGVPGRGITMVAGPSLLLFRFKPDNIFHGMHDDVVPALQTMWGGVGKGAAGGAARPFRAVLVDSWPSTAATRDTERVLVAITGGPLLRLADLSEPRDADTAGQQQQEEQQGQPPSLVCFEEAYVGIDKASTWYQYGFDKPQGPVLPHAPGKGQLLRQAAAYVAHRLAEERDAGSELRADRLRKAGNQKTPQETRNKRHGTSADDSNSISNSNLNSDRDSDSASNGKRNGRDDPSRTVHGGADKDDPPPIQTAGANSKVQPHAHAQPPTVPPPGGHAQGPLQIVLFSRTRNRLLLNEEELCNVLEAVFKSAVTVLRMETHDLEAQIEVLQNTDVAIGLHGSALVMAMFLPAGATLLELFPFGISADRYTPYKTMAELDGMGLRYIQWTNEDESASVAHPDRAANLGGIRHLPADEQARIQASHVPVHTCCTNPYWLYRIYQDTAVDIAAIVALLSSPPAGPPRAGGQAHAEAGQADKADVTTNKNGDGMRHRTRQDGSDGSDGNIGLSERRATNPHRHLFAPPAAAAATAIARLSNVVTPGKVSAIHCKTQHVGTADHPIWQLKVTFAPPWNRQWLHAQVAYEVYSQELGIAWQTLDPVLILEGDEVFALPSHTLWIRAKTSAGVAAGKELYGQYAAPFACHMW